MKKKREWPAAQVPICCPSRKRDTDVRPVGIRASRWAENEQAFALAFKAYATTLEPVASIARRFQFDYHSFKYHIERYHPELVARRALLTNTT